MKIKNLFVIFCFFLGGCAASDVSRTATSNVDTGVHNAKGFADSASNSDIVDSYQNASQATKGAVLGGAAGAITGALSSGIGVLPGTATGAILGASYGSYIDSLTTLKDKLENRGANIIVLGDQILIVIPSARIFNRLSSTIKQPAYSTLALLARYINQYTSMLVKIAVYTDDTGTCSLDQALSEQQAQQVAKVLLAEGVDTRVLYAEGDGSSSLVDKNTMEWDSDNYRIEVSLEKLYV